MNLVVISIMSMAGLAVFFSVVLAAAHRKFQVEEDSRVHEVAQALPTTNCGACGFPSCEVAAEAIVKGEVPFDSCRAGGYEVTEKIAGILGIEVGERGEPEIAIAKCGGGKGKVAMRYDYEGVLSCHAAQIVASGPLACNYGCLGFGDCARSCPFDAMSVGDDNLPKVDPTKCTACGVCIQACPRGIMTLISKSSQIAVLCNSKEKGKSVRQVCKVGCIACISCEKVCPTDPKAIVVQDNLAGVDYDLCTSCLKCVEKCPTKCIVKVDEGVITFPKAIKKKVPA